VLNSTATVFTLDIYQRMLRPQATQKHLVRVGVISSVVILGIAIALGGMVGKLGGSLFEYIQSLYAFFAPPFAAVFLLGILWRRTNAAGALTAVILGFALGLAMKFYVSLVPDHPAWLDPYWNQASVNWLFCVAVCIVVSLATQPPRPEQVTDQLTLNWSKLNIFSNLGNHW
jgi:SSS family solute:Na+ symporter